MSRWSFFPTESDSWLSDNYRRQFACEEEVLKLAFKEEQSCHDWLLLSMWAYMQKPRLKSIIY